MGKNIYMGLDEAVLNSLAEQKRKKNAETFVEKQISNHQMRKLRNAKLEGTEEILRRNIAIHGSEMDNMLPDDPALKANAEAIKDCATAYKIINDSRTQNKKIIAPIIGAGVVAVGTYGLEKMGHINLTGGLKTLGSGALKAITGKLGKSE